jgi:hypothetical protein
MGGQIGWDPDLEEGGEDENGNSTRAAEIGLTHELGHVKDYVKGDYRGKGNDPQTGNPLKEKNSLKYENIIRKHYKIHHIRGNPGLRIKYQVR